MKNLVQLMGLLPHVVTAFSTRFITCVKKQRKQESNELTLIKYCKSHQGNKLIKFIFNVSSRASVHSETRKSATFIGM